MGAAKSAVPIAAELSTATEITLASLRPVRLFPQRVLGVDFHSWLKWTRLGRTRWLSDQGTAVRDDGRYRAALAGAGSRGAPCPGEAFHNVLFANGFRPAVGCLKGGGWTRSMLAAKPGLP